VITFTCFEDDEEDNGFPEKHYNICYIIWHSFHDDSVKKRHSLWNFDYFLTFFRCIVTEWASYNVTSVVVKIEAMIYVTVLDGPRNEKPFVQMPGMILAFFSLNFSLIIFLIAHDILKISLFINVYIFFLIFVQ
jgi:hypothetical protein